jgi:hypothetical protein
MHTLVLATVSGDPIAPNNVLRWWVLPACEPLHVPRFTCTCRRPYSSWAADKGVPGKVLAQLVGDANVDAAKRVHASPRGRSYTQVLEGAAREAAATVGAELYAAGVNSRGHARLAAEQRVTGGAARKLRITGRLYRTLLLHNRG